MARRSDACTYDWLDREGRLVDELRLGRGARFVPGTPEHFARERFGGALVGADGEVRVALDRRPGSRRWLVVVAGPAVAPDGRAAYALRDGLALFARDGAPLRAIELPERPGSDADVALSERVALVRRGGEGWLVDVERGEARRARLPGGPWPAGSLSFSPDGRELWVFAEDAQRVDVVAVPE